MVFSVRICYTTVRVINIMIWFLRFTNPSGHQMIMRRCTGVHEWWLAVKIRDIFAGDLSGKQSNYNKIWKTLYIINQIVSFGFRAASEDIGTASKPFCVEQLTFHIWTYFRIGRPIGGTNFTFSVRCSSTNWNARSRLYNSSSGSILGQSTEKSRGDVVQFAFD